MGGRVRVGGELNTVISVVVEDGRISRMYAVRNPHKLSRLDHETTLARSSTPAT
jgi:RNA polymerase sigma-70 factor (ECF subfamily)